MINRNFEVKPVADDYLFFVSTILYPGYTLLFTISTHLVAPASQFYLHFQFTQKFLFFQVKIKCAILFKSREV